MSITYLTHAVRENEGHTVRHSLNQVECFFELVFRFPAEAADEVGTQRHLRTADVVNPFNELEVSLAGVITAHQRQNPVTTRLGGQVYRFADIGSIPYQFQHFHGKVLNESNQN